MERLREKHRVVTNVKDDALRISMSFFNNEDDLEKAIWALKTEAAPAKPREPKDGRLRRETSVSLCSYIDVPLQHQPR